MKKYFLFYSLLLWVLPGLQAQTQVDLKTQSKSVDLSGAAFTIPARTGTVLPATCLLGEVFFKTNGPSGQNIYTCAPVNTWTLQVGVTVAATSNLLAGDNSGNAVNSGIAATSLVTLTGTQTLTNKSISAGQITGLAPSATTDTTNASNIIGGTLGAARLPNPTATALGGVEALTPASHNFLTGISVFGVPSAAQPSVSDISGYVAPVNPDWSLSAGLGQILNKPTALSAFTNDTNFVTSSALSSLALSGDVTGTASASKVAKVNGASVPASISCLGSNSSGQLISGSCGSSGGGATISSVTNLIAGNGSGNGVDSGIAPASVVTLAGTQTLTNKSIAAAQITGVLGTSAGGTGTATPSLVAGPNVTISGTWPNQTVAATATGSSAFSGLTSSTNSTAAMVVGTGASLATSGSGTIAASSVPASGVSGVLTVANGGNGTASPSLVAGPNVTISGTWPNQTVAATATGSSAFSGLTSSTNSTAAMVVGTGASLATSGSGTIAASSVPASGVSGVLAAANGGTGTTTGIPVQSVAGRTGAITLTTADVGGYTAPVNADWNATSGLAQILNKPATNNATTVNGGAVPVSQACVGTNASSQIVAGTCLAAANNLSDVASASAARTNLGLGTAATQASTAFDASGAASSAQAASLQKANNLSDLASASTARTNLGLSGAATATLPLSVANGGSGSATPSLVAGPNVTISGTWPNQTVAASATGSSAFSGLTSSTNSTAAMVVGTGASLATSGTGTIAASSVPASGVSGVLTVANGGNGTASPSLVAGQNVTISGTWPNQTVASTATGSPAFSGLTSSTNSTASMVVGTGASLATSGTGTIAASSVPASGVSGVLGTSAGGTGTTTPSLVAGQNVTISGTWPNQTVAASATGSSAFSGLTSSTNSTAAMVVGTGASLATSGSGTIAASSVPASGVSGVLAAANGGTGTTTGIPVQSVAGRTGAITLTTADVGGYTAPVNADWNATSGLAQILNKPATNNATTVNGGAVPVSQACVGTNASSQIVAGTCLAAANNLSDVASASAARTNLGLGTAATQASTAFDASGAASSAQAASLQKANNLSDLASASTARTNLGLSGAATATLPLSVSNGGNGTATPSLVAGSNVTISGTWPNQTVAATATGSSAFSGLTSSTNSTAAMVVGTGASLATSGTGTIAASSVPASGVSGVLAAANGGTGTTSPSLVAGPNVTISGTWPNQTVAATATGSSAFSGLTSSTNSTAAMVVGTGASLATSGSGTIAASSVPASGVSGVLTVANGGNGTASPSLVAGPNVTISGTWPNQTVAATATGSSAFSGLTSSTNSTAAMVVGTGASLATSGSGTIAASSVPASGVSGVLAAANGGTGSTTGIPVQSVAGRTGAITLTTADVGGYTAPVNADWNATSGLAQILNKPAINNATTVNGGAVPVSQACVGTNASSQIVAGTCLAAANNLSDLASASTARTNLGLGTAATQASTAFDASGAASSAQAASLQKANNLSDLASASTARTNLGLSGAATATLPLSVANGGSGSTTPSLVAGPNVTISGTWPNQTVAATATGSSAFSGLTSSTNSTAAMVVGTGASLATSGTGTIAASSVPASGVSGVLAAANGGTGTTAASLVGGSNVTVSGAWPNQTIASAIPNPTSTTLGGTQSIAPVSHNFLTGISTSGVPSAAQPSFSDISGVLSLSAGGTGTTTPSLVAGSNVTITGTWPNQTISAASGSGGSGGGLNPPESGSGLLIGSASSATTTIASADVDYQSATSRSVSNYGNGQTNGIQSAVVACGTTVSCSIVAPPTYGATENRPCYWGNVGQPFSTNGCSYTMSPNVTFFDYRYGVYSQNADSGGVSPSTNYQAWQRMDYITTAPLPQNNPALYFTSKVASNVNLLALGGGVNINVAAYPNKAFYVANDTRLHGYTGGQKIGYQSFVTSYAVGDALGYYGINTCYGGFNAGSDEGCEAMDIQATQGTVEYTGTVSSTSANTVTVAATIGDGTQGEGRFLVDTSQAITGGTIGAIGTTGPVVLTGSGTSWPVSTVNTTSSSTVAAPGSATITVASAAGITTSTTLCVADGYELEQVVPTAVSGTSITANFRYPHQPGMFVTAGGLSCHFIALTADIANSASFPTLAYNLQNALHWVVPIISSSSSTSLTLWLQSPNSGWVGYRGRWTAANGGYAIYPGAQVTSVMQNQKLSSTLTLETPVVFANGDAVILPQYHNLNVYEALHSVQRVFPQVGGGNPAAWWMQLNGLWTDTDTAMEVDNNTPASVYAGGKSRPLFMHPRGSWDSILYFDAQPSNMARSDDSSGPMNIFMQSSNLGYAYIGSDPINHRWTMANYFNGSYIVFDWQAGNIQTTGKIYAAGYVTPQIQTGVATNTDLAGFVTLSSGTGTYSFTGGYTNPPACTANDNTAVAAVRVQTTSTTMTLTGTGNDMVSYNCIARF